MSVKCNLFSENDYRDFLKTQQMRKLRGATREEEEGKREPQKEQSGDSKGFTQRIKWY